MHTVETPEEMEEALDRGFVLGVTFLFLAGIVYMFAKWHPPIAWPLG